MHRYRFDGGLGKPVNVAHLKRSRGGSWTRKAKQHKANNVQCVRCGAIANLEADHIVPLHRGGTNDASNIQSLCVACHREKTAREAMDRR